MNSQGFVASFAWIAGGSRSGAALPCSRAPAAPPLLWGLPKASPTVLQLSGAQTTQSPASPSSSCSLQLLELEEQWFHLPGCFLGPGRQNGLCEWCPFCSCPGEIPLLWDSLSGENCRKKGNFSASPVHPALKIRLTWSGECSCVVWTFPSMGSTLRVSPSHLCSGAWNQLLTLSPSLRSQAEECSSSHRLSPAFRVNTAWQWWEQLVLAPWAGAAPSLPRQLPPFPNLSSRVHGLTFSLTASSHGSRGKMGKQELKPTMANRENGQTLSEETKLLWFYPAPAPCTRELGLCVDPGTFGGHKGTVPGWMLGKQPQPLNNSPGSQPPESLIFGKL